MRLPGSWARCPVFWERDGPTTHQEPGKDQNSKFKVQFLQNMYCSHTIMKSENHESNHPRSRTIWTLPSQAQTPYYNHPTSTAKDAALLSQVTHLRSHTQWHHWDSNPALCGSRDTGQIPHDCHMPSSWCSTDEEETFKSPFRVQALWQPWKCPSQNSLQGRTSQGVRWPHPAATTLVWGTVCEAQTHSLQGAVARDWVGQCS